jgi:predicted RNase H-like HicB family nuclease
MRYVLLYIDEEGNWIAEAPSLPGCSSNGATREEAIERIREAIGATIEALMQDDLPVPEEFAQCELVSVEALPAN